MIPGLTEATIRSYAWEQSFERGRVYYLNDSVSAVQQRGDMIEAAVRGSEYEPYYVLLRFDQSGITEATCTCPYDYGDWCKHIVAVALFCMYKPDAIESKAEIATLLKQLNEAQLRALLVKLATTSRTVVEAIEDTINARTDQT